MLERGGADLYVVEAWINPVCFARPTGRFSLLGVKGNCD